MNGSGWTVPIARWAIWRADAADDQPDVKFIDPMLRRRLSLLSRMTLKVANDCIHDKPEVRFVFASRHGDLGRTTTLLESLATGEELSPTSFSLSVLNASAGVLSILRRDTSPSTAISATGSSFGFGLLEAASQLAADPSTPVLLVYADEPVPALYDAEYASGPAHALALLLECDAKLAFNCAFEAAAAQTGDEGHSLAFLRTLETGCGGVWHGENRRWSWKNVAAQDAPKAGETVQYTG